MPLAKVENFPLPVLGFCAWSCTGKTTLLTQLIPQLKAAGIRLGVIKHAHHSFEIDHESKDSYKLRKAGAAQMVIASSRKIAVVTEKEVEREADLSECLQQLDPALLDLVLVEGFKSEAFPKIELHRQSLGKPLLYEGDSNIIAIATDSSGLETNKEFPIPHIDLNDMSAMVSFIKALLY